MAGLGAIRLSIVTFEYDTRSVEAFLQRLGSVALSDGVKRAVAEGMLSATVKSFESEQSPKGVAWAPLAASTQRKKKGRGSILRDSGLMFSSLRALLIAGQPAVAVGATLPDARAEYAQNGTNRAPRRPFFPDNDQASDAWWAGVTRPIRDAWRATK